MRSQFLLVACRKLRKKGPSISTHILRSDRRRNIILNHVVKFCEIFKFKLATPNELILKFVGITEIGYFV